MEQISKAYIVAKQNNLVQTTWVTLPPLAVLIENQQKQWEKIQYF